MQIYLVFFVKNQQSTEQVKPDELPIDELPIEKPDASKVKFGEAITLKVNEKITFSNGLVVILTDINDSRCSKDVVCIWQGELAIILELSGNISEPGEVHLGTVNKKSVYVEGYTVSLEQATENSATIVVVKN